MLGAVDSSSGMQYINTQGKKKIVLFGKSRGFHWRQRDHEKSAVEYNIGYMHAKTRKGIIYKGCLKTKGWLLTLE